MTVVARRIRATPERSATDTWGIIVNLISSPGSLGRCELSTVEGIASSLIADETPRDAPIVVVGCGPRLRIYCLYGEDAIIGEAANENQLGWNPTETGWKMWLPAEREDLEWVKDALSKGGERFAVYVAGDDEPARDLSGKVALSVNEESFRKP